ncbi:hypothetical protein L226DRAFT_72643 [Lentinus tigrinus ALCF2SS1-7]|uniref:Uncharacterized protein n=1 Tax=Lentinus tigrinus ALCF2SS1-6 TaxID=1328759 RepID=A0A5C2SFG1_9APHY|nr:hypothetical protein L227DRAFT_42733 [Lentinus tigrinus ALCF2SS1-6]RPD74383.1 hypothetical protein L226DRAFT_72643 [Lentinus tigrinus ALCF2SS1-7]
MLACAHRGLYSILHAPSRATAHDSRVHDLNPTYYPHMRGTSRLLFPSPLPQPDHLDWSDALLPVSYLRCSRCSLAYAPPCTLTLLSSVHLVYYLLVRFVSPPAVRVQYGFLLIMASCFDSRSHDRVECRTDDTVAVVTPRHAIAPTYHTAEWTLASYY